MAKFNLENTISLVEELRVKMEELKLDYDKTGNFEALEEWHQVRSEVWKMEDHIRYYDLTHDLEELTVEELTQVMFNEFDGAMPQYKSKKKIINEMATLRSINKRMSEEW